MATRSAWVAWALVSPPAVATAIVWGFYVAGNGLVGGAFALATVPLGLLVAPAVAIPGRVRAVACLALALALAGDLAFVAARWAAVRRGPFVACVNGDCARAAPWVARVVREDETVFAGTVLAEALGLLGPAARAQLDLATHRAYAQLHDRTGGPGVNALALGSSGERVAELVWLPPGEETVPGIVFLHGFGGLLTPYLSSLTESPELARCAIVAPALGHSAEWWTDEGLAVVRRTVATLPSRVDRNRLVLVGLSNGAVGVSAIAADPELAGRFQAAVAMMGGSDRFGTARLPVLILAAEDDDRFELAHLRDVQAGLGGGAPVELLVVSGGHFALFTHPMTVNSALADWLAER